MQKKIIALAVAGLASTAAFAQTNVTIYGVADVGFANVTAAGHQNTKAIVSGGLAGSRIGFKGTEDLGNGLKAIFTLEYALAVDQNAGVNGDQASNVARQQFVGLSSDKFGTAVAGYLQTAGYDFACAANPVAGGPLDGYTLVSGGASLLSCGAKGRAGNAVAYISPSFGGVTVALNHARVSEDAYNNATGNDAYANLLAVNYANGPISVGAVYSKINAQNTVASDDNTVEYGLRASYDFKVAKLFASYQVADAKATSGKNSKWQVSASVPTTATGAAHVMYARNKMDDATAHNVSDDNSSAWTLAYTHGMSKRTTLYAGYTKVFNDSLAALPAFGIYPQGNSNPALNKTSLSPVADGNASILALGINHKF